MVPMLASELVNGKTMRLIQKDELENINGGILPAIAAGIAAPIFMRLLEAKKGLMSTSLMAGLRLSHQ
ncbi:class IIb bacteriocin, lactobin A/cerein 7B family [Alteromonas sp. 14N.309.X.WAT.G.H12]|uniref:class IIb bacteriocin, lactobin A/cerein 7B family n=1 Tax=Alteromonas sp. 14N.309.X.WAT.G.H12 TaxID=3120824 RepID=UPI003A599857